MSAGLTRRDFLAGAALAVLPAWLGGCRRGPKEKAVNFFNWSSYIGKDTLARFTRETGIPVNYEEFADEEEMFAKLRSGARGYDLIVGTDYMIPRLKALNLIDPYPPGALTRLGNIAPRFRDTPYDPGAAHTVPYLWGTTGIGFNSSKLKRPPASWWDLWEESHRGRITVLDNSRDVVSTALLLLGYPETTADPEAFRKVRDLLLRQKPLVKQYSSSTYTDMLVAGEAHLSMAWSGDVLQAARENPRIDFVIPKEGSYMWVDCLCLVRGSENRPETLRLVDYLLREEVAAEVANAVRYASPNAAALPLLDKALREDPRVFPRPEVASRLRFHALLEPEASRLWTETWTDVKVA